MCKDKEQFTTMGKTEGQIVEVANGIQVPVKGKGTVKFATKMIDGKAFNLELQDIYYIPELRRNLLSVRKMSHEGHTTNFGPEGNFIDVDSEERNIINLQNAGELYEIRNCELAQRWNDAQDQEDPDLANLTLTRDGPQSIDVWHARFGHLGSR